MAVFFPVFVVLLAFACLRLFRAPDDDPQAPDAASAPEWPRGGGGSRKGGLDAAAIAALPLVFFRERPRRANSSGGAAPDGDASAIAEGEEEDWTRIQRLARNRRAAGRQALPRSNSTGHSASDDAGMERFALRLPEHVRLELLMSHRLRHVTSSVASVRVMEGSAHDASSVVGGERQERHGEAAVALCAGRRVEGRWRRQVRQGRHHWGGVISPPPRELVHRSSGRREEKRLIGKRQGEKPGLSTK
ncbi:unnamed protein product [Miscanthus lutarioriparius]|uniref:Uncharacterized protein n=1 Tax=Miscanthus lutarioriparius TaxID=422564 RepID=A0A811Q201_9POAL|nr:unnamed protein product [Miscanthus lutarioriparius]